MKGDSWVTIASTDIEAWKALVLAKSLKSVFTSKSITIGITENVSQQFRYNLETTFDAVIPILESEIGVKDDVSAGWRKLFLKLWCWKLRMYKKCIFIDPSSLFLENAEELFTDYDEFAVSSKEYNDVNGSIVDSAIFVLKPNINTYYELIASAKKLKKPNEAFPCSFFEKWNATNVTQIEKRFQSNDLGSYNSISHQSKIINFTSEPWTQTKECGEWVKNAKCKWLSTFILQVIPEVKMLEEPESTFLMDTIRAFGLPTTNGPLKQVEDTSLGELKDSIAVVGIAGRFPGSNDMEEFWNTLISGIDPISTFPKDRPHLTFTEIKNNREAGYLKCPIEEFDAKFFEISPREAQLIDPQQRILLEVIWESLENGSIDPQELHSTNTSMFLGIWQQEYEHNLPLNELTENDFYHRYLGNALSATAGRISNFLGLFGPNIALESGCSSSASALHLACKSLREFETNLAIVGGVNLILSEIDPLAGKPVNSPIFSKNFRCKTFDESADGFARSEGCAVAILKRYSDARYDGDNILGIIRGTSLNNDGPGTGFGTPNAVAQERVFREALINANVPPSDVSYVEAHGTGTFIGDPTEMHAIAQVYKSNKRDQTLLISSVKTNIGHTESCAGLAGLIKILLSMKHKVIPPHLHLKNLNPKIDLASIPAKIPTQATEWKVADGKARIAALNSFSMSGTNVHVIVQEPPNSINIVPVNTHTGVPQMIQISAKSTEALDELVKRYITYLENINPTEIMIDEFAYHTNMGRASLPHRLTIVANDMSQVLEKLKKKAFNSDKIPAQSRKVGFLFSGQGSQYFGMTRNLYEKFINFKIPLDYCDNLIQTSLGISLQEILWGKPEHLDSSVYCQPAIFSIEFSLAYFWKSFGIEPDYVLGHSVGEFAAATTAGILSLEEAMTLVIERSKLVQGLGHGSMSIIRAGSKSVIDLIQEFEVESGVWVDIAAINSDEEVVVSGPSESIRAFAQFTRKRGIKSQELQAETAFHSRVMDPVLKKFGLVVKEKVKPKKPTCKFISGTLAKEMESTSEFGPNYWVQHLRDPVKFSDSIKILWQECKILVEIGAQPILLGLAMANVNDQINGSYIPVLRKNEEDVQATFSALSKMYLSGLKINWKRWFGRRQTKLYLPTYPFQRQKFWLKGDETEDFADLSIPHPLLGHLLSSPVSETIFTQKYQLNELEYIKDHKVVSRVILPGAAYLEAMLAAAQAVVTRGNGMKIPLTIENFTIEAALELDKPYKIQIIVSPQPEQDAEKGETLQYKISIHKQIGSQKWKRYAVGYFKPSSNTPEQSSIDLNQIKERNLVNEEDMEIMYKKLWDKGIEFGPKFKSIISAWTSPNEALLKVHLPEQHEEYVCHPIILDAMIQALALTEGNKNENMLRLPTGIRKFVHLPNEMTNDLYIYRKLEGDVHEICLVNARGDRLGIMYGIDTISTTKDSFIRALTEQKLDIPYLYEEIWLPRTSTMGKRVDPKLFRIPTKYTNFVSKVDGINKGEETKAYMQSLDQYFVYLLIRGIQECDWNWPSVGEVLKPQDWFAVTQKHLKHLGLIEYCMEILLKENYLIQPNPEVSEFKVMNELLPPSQCQLKMKEKFRCIFEQDECTALFCKRCDTCFNDVLSGKISTIEYMFPEDPKEYGVVKFYTESRLYNSISEIATSMILDAVEPLTTHSNYGILRILEVGAGSGKSSAQLMEKLNQLNISFHYTFTDISQIFLLEASKQFDKNVTFGILNIENDPLVQGFPPETFDIILAAQVIHATTDIMESLKVCNMLLREGGILVLSEQFQSTPMVNLSVGFLDGWWSFSDFRKTGPIIDFENWKYCLKEAGFEESNHIPLAEGIYGGVIAKKAKLKLPTKISELDKSWIILIDNPNLQEALIKTFNQYGRQVKVIEYDVNIQEMQISPQKDLFKVNPKRKEHFESLFQEFTDSVIEGIIYIWMEDHCEYSIQERQEIYCGGLLFFCQSIIKAYETKTPKPKINLITKGLHTIGDEGFGPVDSSTSIALVKVLKNEADFHTILFDISEDPSFHVDEMKEVFENFWGSGKEYFLTFRNGKKWVQRLVPVEKKLLPLTMPNSERFKAINPETNTPKDIVISATTRKELQENEIEVSIKATSMNFRDLFVILKPEGFPLPKSLELGFDVSGIVSAIGKYVTRFKVGDEVIGGAYGSFSSHIVSDESRFIKKPVNLSFTSASTVSCVFLTSYYSLIDCAKLKPTDRVLIHAATGGVGLSAFRIAKHVGAEVFATAGSKKKRAYLRNLGIKYIYHSRNTDFEQQILNDTNGLGVSVVLNSLTSEGFKEASLKVCSKGGRFVEIGKANIWTEEDLKALRPDVEYFPVDLSDPADESNLETTYQDLERFMEENPSFCFGIPHVTYPLDLIHEAFQRFQETKHIGKIVVKIPRTTLGSDGNWEFVHEVFDSESTYLITGGLGGIGMELARWMTNSGAKHIVLAGRNLPSKQSQNIITQLNKLGNNLIAIQADVSDYSQCSGLLDIIKSRGLPPLRGIFHAAGVLADAILSNQSWDKFKQTFSSKVYAAWNLHTLTLDPERYDIEYFVNFSSGSAIMGTPGQSNHSAANRYLDALTHYRQSVGLSAQTINFGAWSDIGAAANIKLGTEGSYGMQSFTPRQGINGIEKILTEKFIQLIVIGEVDWGIVKQYWKFGNYFERLQSQKSTVQISERIAKMIEKVKQAKQEERQGQLEEFLETLIKQMLRLPEDEKLDKDQNFNELGVDSLIGMEMKNHLQGLFNNHTLSISSLEGHRTIRLLSEHLAQLMNSEDPNTELKINNSVAEEEDKLKPSMEIQN